MKNMLNGFRTANEAALGASVRFRQDSRGQDLIEYAMIGGFMTLIAVAAIQPVLAAVSLTLVKIIGSMDGLGTSLNPG